MDAKDPDVGISIRFIRAWDDKADVTPGSLTDQALMLASHDERDVPTMDKIADAIAFLKSRIH